jgi:hypothetical protein
MNDLAATFLGEDLAPPVDFVTHRDEQLRAISERYLIGRNVIYSAIFKVGLR